MDPVCYFEVRVDDTVKQPLASCVFMVKDQRIFKSWLIRSIFPNVTYFYFCLLYCHLFGVLLNTSESLKF